MHLYHFQTTLRRLRRSSRLNRGRQKVIKIAVIAITILQSFAFSCTDADERSGNDAGITSSGVMRSVAFTKSGAHYIEAEDFTSRTTCFDSYGDEKHWRGVSEYNNGEPNPSFDAPGYSGATYMRAEPDINTDCVDDDNNQSTNPNPRLNYEAVFTEPGHYAVQVKMFGRSVSSDSLRIGVTDHTGVTTPLTTDANGVVAGPAWSWQYKVGESTSVFAVTQADITAADLAGEPTKTINIWMREDGVAIDKLMIVKADAFFTKTGKNFVEAEDFTNRTTCTDTTDSNVTKSWSGVDENGTYFDAPGYSGLRYMRAEPDHNTECENAVGDITKNPRLDYEVKFTKPGKYLILVRMFGRNLNSNSIRIGVGPDVVDSEDDEVLTTGGNGVVADTAWSWKYKADTNAIIDVSQADINNGGTKIIKIWMREDGVAVDRLMILDSESVSKTGPGTVHLANESGTWLIEAENYSYLTGCTGTNGLAKNWYRSSAHAGYSGEEYMQALPNDNTGCTEDENPRLDYNVSFTEPGDYVVMVKLQRGPGDTDDNLLEVGMDEDVLTQLTGPEGWEWRHKFQTSNNPPEYTTTTLNDIAAGSKTINIWMKKDGIIVDKLYIVKKVPDEFLDNYDPDLGAWGDLTRSTPSYLMAAELLDSREGVEPEDLITPKLPVLEILQKLRDKQNVANFRKGFFWKYTDAKPEDYNADFFVLVNLIPLYLEFYADKPATDPARQVIESMFDEAWLYMPQRLHLFTQEERSAIVTAMELKDVQEKWPPGRFDKELKKALKPLDEEDWRYPNAMIGDLVVTYLLAKILDSPQEPLPGVRNPAAIESEIRDAFEYYVDNNWGWGEHLSDGYAKVIQDELSLLIFYAGHFEIPDDITDQAIYLLRDLVAIDEQFSDGIRVPAIRSYALGHTPSGNEYQSKMFSQTVAPIPDEIDPKQQHASPYSIRELWFRGPNHQLSGNWWQDMVGPVEAAGNAIPLFNKTGTPRGVYALNSKVGELYLGAMTRYPIMDDIDKKGWGLLWQSMPASFWHATKKDWGFLQWEVSQDLNGESYTHALPTNSRYNYDSRTLSANLIDIDGDGKIDKYDEDTTDSPLPETRGAAIQGGYVVVRTMPEILDSWTSVEDRTRILDGTATRTVVDRNYWDSLKLDWGGGDSLTVDHLPLHNLNIMSSEDNYSENDDDKDGEMDSYDYDWGFRYALPSEPDDRPDRLASIWLLRNDASQGLPTAFRKANNPNEFSDSDAWTLYWKDGTHLNVQPYYVEFTQPNARVFEESGGQVTMEAENGRFAGRMDHKSWWLMFDEDRVYEDESHLPEADRTVPVPPGMSNGRYVTIDRDAPPADKVSEYGQINFYFEVDVSFDYHLLARLNTPNGKDDSYFFRINGGDYIKCNGYKTGPDHWKWKQCDDPDLGEGNVKYLETGTRHHLQIYYREDGTNLDKFVITRHDLLTGSTTIGPAESPWQND